MPARPGLDVERLGIVRGCPHPLRWAMAGQTHVNFKFLKFHNGAGRASAAAGRGHPALPCRPRHRHHACPTRAACMLQEKP